MIWFVMSGAQLAAQEVGLAGVFPGKALLTIVGGPPRTVPVGGTTPEGVKLLAVASDSATIEVEGRKRVLRVGQQIISSASPDEANARAVLTADSGGHFLTTGTINGASVRFLVDTGASTVALGHFEARRIGIDPTKGRRRWFHTPNGAVMVSVVKLDAVRVGDIVLHQVEAAVLPHDIPVALLGLSFLNHLNMQRDGETMILTRRF